MAPSPLQQRKTHNTLLFQKLLNLRDGASPFTLLLDNLEQRSGGVVREFVRRAKISKTKIIFISFATIWKKISFEADVFITARSMALAALRSEIVSHIPQAPVPSSSSVPPKYLLIVDTLTPLCTLYASHISNFLSSLLLSPQISLLATYHLDVPVPHQSTALYTPHPLTTLTYLSTSILTLSALPQILAQKRARDKSLQAPTFGLSSLPEGALISLTKNSQTSGAENGIVIHAELRRRSGRGIVEDFVLIPSYSSTKSSVPEVILLDEHPLYLTPTFSQPASGEGEDPEDMATTFNLCLTEKQKRDRENVVLPYFDAQKDGGGSGAGEGGRILYDMGDEDREDFDDEEDEI
ncbi:hypothetical protein HYALB_00000450 [Hymenoscyphus albidus]|uniref:Elongator complex protein 5 n=1 Tax=Hymenoscyphus albidus TaxID=595503 RepID=A0A9N9Q0D4_9HELO|nr:hypothetical protein HYALB_00000450 [Hymenoscyphus albidus]